jgi:hypothetical protein
MSKFLSEVVTLNEQFRRSINIAADTSSIENLQGFVCPATAELALKTIIKQIKETSESSFTWTGPFGSGKSSLALLLKALTSQDATIREYAASKISEQNRNQIQDFFDKDGWKEISIVGTLCSPEEAFKRALGLSLKTSTEKTIQTLIELSSEAKSGLIVYIDEMGKFLENQSSQNYDIYFFQLLAEVANRSNGKLIIIGILHQSFSEYARNLTKKSRDEWNKIQGRFIDIPLNIASDEQIGLIGQAITSAQKPKSTSTIAKVTATIIAKHRKTDEELLARKLNNAWPLHPVTAVLISELSKKRFGQNQRSIFSFLMSAEPLGFRDFLQSTLINSQTLYTPDMLWEYLATNLESTIVFSNDAKAWATASDSISKCEASNDKANHAKVLKAIATINIFKGKSGLEASEELIQNVFDFDTQSILKELESWSFILYKKHTGGYALYEGSDFDIDEALTNAYQKAATIETNKANSLASIKPIIAKRHYHSTGALRWLHLTFQPVSSNTEKMIAATKYGVSEIGKIICLLPKNLDEYHSAQHLIEQFTDTPQKNIVIGIAKNYQNIYNVSQELNALEWINDNEAALSGDSIARREVESRIAFLSKTLETQLYTSIENAEWLHDGTKRNYRYSQLSELASQIADEIYHANPLISNEMLNRDKPSGNANAALKALLKSMTQYSDTENLGLIGYPPERGFYDSIIKKQGLHCEQTNWQFISPNQVDNPNLFLLWKETTRFLSEQSQQIVISDIYEYLWSKHPFGVKKGLFLPLILSFILTMKDQVAIYLDESYYTELDDYFIDYLFGTPKNVSIKLVTRTSFNDTLLTGVSRIIKNYAFDYSLDINSNSSPLEVARALVKVISSQNKWIFRTKTLSKPCIQLREIVNAAHDPNKLLFEDIPKLLEVNKEHSLESLIQELTSAYPQLIERIGKHLLEELNVQFASETEISNIQSRAKKLTGKTGDFRVDAFVSRLSIFDATNDSIAGIASLAANKPIHDWIDQDIQRSLQEISSLVHQFNKAELLVKISDAPAERESFGILIKSPHTSEVLNTEIELLASEKATIDKIKQKILTSLNSEIDDLRLKQAAISAIMKDLIISSTELN